MSKYDLLVKTKNIHIPISGNVSLSLMAKYFIDNKYFQRLTQLKQLGTCDMVFSGAKHSRFEHSIGTYYLTERLCNRILTLIKEEIIKEEEIIKYLKNIPEIKDNIRWVFELVKIGGLCHDLGHGAFSHIFDDSFISQSIYKNHELAEHEKRSCYIIELIYNNNEILKKYMTENDIKFIQTIINPDKTRTGFIYQIVSNTLNGLDVDKYDYISRDTLHTGIKCGFDFSKLVDEILIINNNIVYPTQSIIDIYNLLITRYQLHKRLYSHKSVVSAQLIITNIMKILDKVINISDSILDMNKFVLITDDYIIQTMKRIIYNEEKEYLTKEEFEELKELNYRIENHKLYKHIDTLISNKDNINIKKYFKDEYIIFKNKIGFVSGDKPNPLDNVFVYKTKDLIKTAKLLNPKEVFLPSQYQEYNIMIFSKNI